MREQIREIVEAYEPARLEGDSLVPAAVLLLLYEREGVEHLLFQVRTHLVEHHKGEISLPGGASDPRDGSLRATALRETHEEIGEGFVHVPAGKFVYGEDKELTTKELPDFAIAKYPVTFAEYLEFLETLDDEEAEQRKPQTSGDGPYVEEVDGVWRILPILVEAPAREWCEQTYGTDFDLRCPVIGIEYDDAESFCQWKSGTTGKEWRLPTEEEREKAARGVDGRRFPWGDLEDASLGKCRFSREVPSQPEPVGAFPTAASVYDMGDAAGGVWDWTDSWQDDRRSSRVLRGGSWDYPPSVMRAARRTADLPRVRFAGVGFRCARGL